MCRRFIKENPALAAGIGLPIALVILFSLAAIVPQWMVGAPRYSVLFLTDEYRAPPEYEIHVSVVGNHVQAKYSKLNQPHGNITVHLHLFDTARMTVHEIILTPPAGAAPEQPQEFPVPEVGAMTVDSNLQAPDGYEFSNRYGRGGDFGWPFLGGGYAYGQQAIISNHGRVIPIPIPQNSGDARFYNFNNIKFLGWVPTP